MFGEKSKIFTSNSTLAWAALFGTGGYTLDLSLDLSYLIAGMRSASTAILGVIESSNG